MNKIDRTKVGKPKCLEEKAESWTNKLIEKRKENPKYWNWHEYKNEKVEHILTIVLSELTNKHCSYCDIRPLVKGGIKPSIDHFKPKSLFPELAFEWSNLFLSCYQCQEYKGSKYPETEPLKPDNLNYEFDYWFEINWETNEIKPNPLRSLEEQKRANITINWLGLNKDDRPVIRGEELEKYNGENLEDYSYRFFLERA